MPIYAYRCTECGHAEDVLQKMSAAKLTDCPACGKSTYVKQVTAAGFQLKGSGWYVTDFKNNANKPKATVAPNSSATADSASNATNDSTASDAKPSADKPSDSKPSNAKPSEAKPSAPAPTASSSDSFK